MNYYFLGSSLPDLQLGAPPELGFNELMHLLKANLSEEDYAKVMVIRRFYDIENLRALWKGEELDKWGNLDPNELEDALLTHSDFIELPYIDDFLIRYNDVEERLSYFSMLVSGYYADELPRAKGFLFDYLTFEREWRLVLTAFRAKELKRNILKELQWEDADDVTVAQIVAQKDASRYEPPFEYSDLKPLFEAHKHEPFEQYQALCHYRFEKINEMAGFESFSIDGILAFAAKFIIVDKWFDLNRIKGLQIVDAIVEENS